MQHSGRQWPHTCATYGCGNAPALGGHISIKGLKTTYIVPICSSCNNGGGLLPNYTGRAWARANVGTLGVSAGAVDYCSWA